MTDVDLEVARRAGRFAAIQAALALAAVLLIVGGVLYIVEVRGQEQQIGSQLSSVAYAADDVTDPPPGTILVLRDNAGRVAASSVKVSATDLLARPEGFSDEQIDGILYRVLVLDRPEGRVVALLDLEPYEADRSRLLLSLGIAEMAGILAAVAVVSLLTRRSIRPLATALALQRRFVADASHELRAPLTVLHTRIQMLARRFDDGDVVRAREQVDALASDTRVLAEVIEDLLASASMTSDRTPQDQVDLVAIVQAVSESMAEHCRDGWSRLGGRNDRIAVACKLAVVLGSGSALRRAITSLVDNALAHEHPDGTITVVVRRDGSDVCVDVRDDGVGVDPDAMDALFDRFSHGSGHTAAGARPRHGIGLALVREIAHAHGGQVHVTETPGGGATFTLVMPAAVASKETQSRT